MDIVPSLISDLKSALDRELPGKSAQFEMAALGRPSYHAPIREDVRTAAVLIALYERNDNWRTVVMKRRVIAGDRHSGQISFPGGKQENGEPLHFTAIRECHEEIGTSLDDVQLVGRLSNLHIPVSNFIVHPFVAYLPQPGTFRRQESEVQSIHEIPLDHVLDPANRKTTDLRVPEGLVLRDVPYFDIDNEVIWGATAMIMSEFVAVLRSVSKFAV